MKNNILLQVGKYVVGTFACLSIIGLIGIFACKIVVHLGVPHYEKYVNAAIDVFVGSIIVAVFAGIIVSGYDLKNELNEKD